MIKKYSQIFKTTVFTALAVMTALLFVACNYAGNKGNGFNFRISSSKVEIVLGNSVKLTTNSKDEVIWVSLDEDIAQVSENGVITGVGLGKTSVLAVSNNAQAECEVNVVKQPAGPLTVKMSIPSAFVTVEREIQLTAEVSDGSTPEWSSSDPSVATVIDGTVYGISVGTAIITATVREVSATCAVTVISDPNTDKDGYTMIWHDEFGGSSLDMSKWSYQLGTHDVYGESTSAENWGNNELQYYREENIRLDDGVMVITAQKENPKVGGKSFTSGRITSRGKFTTVYGYVEARIKLPAVSGMWPAFWMLPQPVSTDRTGNEYGGWASNGELDIMEARGRLPDEIDTTLHFGGKYPNNKYLSKKAYLSTPISEWHTYAVDWRKEYIAWIVDGVETFRLTYDKWWTSAVDKEENPYAPYDKPFYILLNLAVGGNYDQTGADDIKANESFTSASMYVDYVRVYMPDN